MCRLLHFRQRGLSVKCQFCVPNPLIWFKLLVTQAYYERLVENISIVSSNNLQYIMLGYECSPSYSYGSHNNCSKFVTVVV